MRDQNGQFTKGNPGRPPGATSKINNDLRKKIGLFLENKWSVIESDFDALEPKERVMMFAKLLEFSLPRLQSIAYTTDLEKQIDQLSDEQAERLLKELSNKIISEWTQKQN